MDEGRHTALDLLEGMIAHQEAKVLSLARELVPGLTAEDLRNPHDFAPLRASEQFNFEDGILAGYLSFQAALRSGPSLPLNDFKEQS